MRRERKQEKSRAELALAALPGAIEVLKKYGARRVILFGSLARGNRFRSDSDIDLAVEGVKPEDFLRAYADLMLTMDWPVDLKPLEEIKGFLKEMISKRGKVVYER